jgi:UDP-N-acetyl-D-glucosamine dehydrogenase
MDYTAAGEATVIENTVTAPRLRLDGLIESRRARVGIIGLGYVGLPLVPAVARAGYDVIGFDIDAAKISALRRGRSYIKHIPHASIRELVDRARFEPTLDMANLARADVVLICVPTPLSDNREPDLSFVVATSEAIAAHLRPGQMIVLESTTYPGTTRDVVKPILERSGLRSGTDFFLAYSPEREDPGNLDFKTAQIPKVVGGDGEVARRLVQRLYSSFVVRTVPVSTVETAEAVKLTENIFRTVNIALVNELKVVYDAMGIDVWEVIEAAKSKPFGFMPFYPGPGIGGHCLPVDPFYLTWKAREFDISTRFVELAGEINSAMPLHVVNRVAAALDEKTGKGLNGARILVLGVAYKKDIEDIRESPSLRIIHALHRRGARVEFHDPHVEALPRTRHFPELGGLASTPLDADRLARCDVVLICTDHTVVDYDLVLEHAPLIVDTRNVFPFARGDVPKVVRA